MDKMKQRRIDDALASLDGLSHAQVASLAKGVITPQTIGNIRRGESKRVPLTTVLALEAAVRAHSEERAA
ncbi:MAG: hypothetical protein KDA35_10360 [Hyphomonadaceae bacterium]|nr:hypothetical protein [Hyphomonadaceae bacterium]